MKQEKNNIIFQSQIDSKIKGKYSPFSVSFVVMALGCLFPLYLWFDQPINWQYVQIWFALFILVALVELVVLKMRMPTERIVISNVNNKLLLEVWIDNKVEEALLINDFKCWWNYDYGDNRTDSGNQHFEGSSTAFFPGNKHNSGINLFVLLSTNAQQQILLTECEGSLASNPNWKYHLDDAMSKEKVIPTFSLRKLVKVMEIRN